MLSLLSSDMMEMMKQIADKMEKLETKSIEEKSGTTIISLPKHWAKDLPMAHGTFQLVTVSNFFKICPCQAGSNPKSTSIEKLQYYI